MRRTGLWVGIGAIIAAIVVPVVLLLTMVLPQFRLNEQVVPLDGAPHAVTLPPDAEYAVLAETRSKVGAPSCVLTAPDGAPIRLRAVSGGVTVNNRMVLRTFDTGAGEVVATCAPAPGYADVALGKYPDMGRLLVGIFGAFGFAIAFGGVGSVLVILALVRRSRAS